MIEGRNLSNLGEEDDAKEALEAIKDYFGEGYLKSNKKHRLPKLWRRQDRLSTVELYVLGKCILNIGEENRGWLVETIRSIKRQSSDSTHGFFTEILFLGVFGLHKSKIVPAEKGKAGYDFSANFPNGIKHLISVKNIDASESQKNFQRNSRRLRRKWVEKIRALNVRLGLRVVSSESLDDSDFDEIIIAIKNYDKTSIRNKVELKSNTKLIPFDLPLDNYSSSPKLVSDIVQVFCPSPASENKRYIKKIRNAINNIKRHTEIDEKTSRVIFIRVHVNSDYNFISEKVKELIKEDDSVDCVICYQPSYVRDERNNSLLNHCFMMEASAEFAIKMARSDCYKACIPLGSFSQKQSDVKVVDLEDGGEEILPASDYFFQQGDLFIDARKDVDGSFSCDDVGSPALGIRKHGVLQGTVVTAKATADFEELLVV